MLKWRSILLYDLRNFYTRVFKEKDIPHIYAIALISFVDYLISYSILIQLSVNIDTNLVVTMAIILLAINYLIYSKVEIKKQKVLVFNIVYVSLFFASLISLYWR